MAFVREVVMTHVLERRGSSKNIWKVLGDNGEVVQLYFEFSDRVSVFDIGPIPVGFTGLGRLRCAIAGKLFQALNSAGHNTHYISHDVKSARMYVQPVNIPALSIDYGVVSSFNLMPVELLCRLALTKKFMGRVERGEVDRRRVERLMMFPNWHEGVHLDPPFVECSTKFEEADRYLSDAEAARLICIGHRQLLGHYEVVEKVFKLFNNLFRSSGFVLIDGKLEAALSKFDGSLMFVDSISPDELRLIGSDGRSYDKDPVRQWYQETFPDWYAELTAIKEAFPNDKSQWPTYPALPPSAIIEDMVGRYQAVAEAVSAL